MRSPRSVAVPCVSVSDIIRQQRLGGSIGLLKVEELRRYRGGVEADLMRTVKRALDPAGIMNPGKVLGD